MLNVELNTATLWFADLFWFCYDVLSDNNQADVIEALKIPRCLTMSSANNRPVPEI